MERIPLYKPYIRKEEKTAVLRALNSGVLSRGKEIDGFEKSFAKLVGKKYAVAVNSGTSALHLLVRYNKWTIGDEVITSPFSFISSSNVLLYEKVKPVFVDIDPNTLNIDPVNLESKINKKTKGILLVDIFGLPAFDKKYIELKKKYNLSIVEDSCETLGVSHKHFKVGSIGETVAYGFFSNKQITTGGEGGIVTTDNKKIVDFCRSARDQGRSNKKDWLKHIILGYNYRMTEMQAAMGREQLKRFNYFTKERNKIANKYNTLLSGIPDIKVPVGFRDKKRSWFVYFLLFKDKKTRDNVNHQLAMAGIETQKYFPSIHLFPEFRNLGYKKGDFPVAEFISNTILILPFYVGLVDSDIEKITKIIKQSV